MGGSLSRQRSVGLLLGSSVRLLKQGVAARVAAHDLTPRQFGVLVALFESEGRSVHALAARMGIDDPTTSRVVATLARRGLVRSRPDERDRRVLRIEATPAAQRLRRPLLDVAREVRRSITEGFTPAELVALGRGLQRVLENARRFAGRAGASGRATRSGEDE